MDIASEALLVAILANLISKGGIIFFGGHRSLRRVVMPGLALMLLTAVLLLVLF